MKRELKDIKENFADIEEPYSKYGDRLTDEIKKDRDQLGQIIDEAEHLLDRAKDHSDYLTRLLKNAQDADTRARPEQAMKEPSRR